MISSDFIALNSRCKRIDIGFTRVSFCCSFAFRESIGSQKATAKPRGLAETYIPDPFLSFLRLSRVFSSLPCPRPPRFLRASLHPSPPVHLFFLLHLLLFLCFALSERNEHELRPIHTELTTTAEQCREFEKSL